MSSYSRSRLSVPTVNSPGPRGATGTGNVASMTDSDVGHSSYPPNSKASTPAAVKLEPAGMTVFGRPNFSGSSSNTSGFPSQVGIGGPKKGKTIPGSR